MGAFFGNFAVSRLPEPCLLAGRAVGATLWEPATNLSAKQKSRRRSLGVDETPPRYRRQPGSWFNDPINVPWSRDGTTMMGSQAALWCNRKPCGRALRLKGAPALAGASGGREDLASPYLFRVWSATAGPEGRSRNNLR
jgi:hypothetical protein